MSAPLRLESDSVEVRITDAVRIFGDGPTAVRALGPVDLVVERGEFVAILGPSGSGKSTLLSLAGALDRPTSGRIEVSGRDVTHARPSEIALLHRRTIGFVFQEINLIDGLTVLENVALPLELDGVKRERAIESAREALRMVRLVDRDLRLPSELSGGERQRVAIARALVGERRLLLADEPTGALDSVTGEHVMRTLRRLCDGGRTAIVVTHDPTHAAWADRVLHLRDGRFEVPPAVVDAASRTERERGA